MTDEVFVGRGVGFLIVALRAVINVVVFIVILVVLDGISARIDDIDNTVSIQFVFAVSVEIGFKCNHVVYLERHFFDAAQGIVENKIPFLKGRVHGIRLYGNQALSKDRGNPVVVGGGGKRENHGNCGKRNKEP